MAENKVQFELNLKDNLSAGVARAMRGTSDQTKRMVQGIKESKAASTSAAQTLALVAEKGKQAAQSVDSLARASRAVNNSPISPQWRGMEQAIKKSEKGLTNISRLTKHSADKARDFAASMATALPSIASVQKLVSMDQREVALQQK